MNVCLRTEIAMIKFRFVFCLLIFSLAISSCSSIQVDQPAVATPVPQASPAISTAASPAPQTGVATPTLAGHKKIPVTWANLNLTGRLVYISGGENIDNSPMTIQALDLKTGQIDTIFQAPKGARISSHTVSPDGKLLVMSYAESLDNNSVEKRAIYIMPMDGSGPPQLLLNSATKDDQYFRPEWSGDGKYIYLGYINNQLPTPQGQFYPNFQIYRMGYPDGSLQKVSEWAFWPRASADSKYLVYVSIDPVDGTNKLILSNPDGTNPQQIAMSAKWVPSYIDAPIFSPDGQSILFSAVSVTQASAASLTWFEKLMGVTIASAHNIPSDWWSVPIHGGKAVQITNIQTTGLFASISPDKKYIASDSGNGIFVMRPDGTELTMLVNDSEAVPSTLSWIP
jgi:Tol biopolymer transport system component